MLVTPKCSVRTVKPATTVANHNKLRDSFHSNAVQLDRLSALWTQAVLRLFPNPLRVNGRRVLSATASRWPSAAARCRA